MPNVSFSPLYRPVKVSWVYPLDSDLSIIDRIQSKHARAFLRNLDTFMEAEGFSIEKEFAPKLSLTNFYNSMAREWMNEVLSIWQHSSGLISNKRRGKRSKNLYLPKPQVSWSKIITAKNFEFRSSYKANRQLPIFFQTEKRLAGACTRLQCSRNMKRSPTLLTAGTSRNLFGVINNPGYLIFKLRMGYIPSVQNKATVFQQTTDMPKNRFGLVFFPWHQRPNNHYHSMDLAI